MPVVIFTTLPEDTLETSHGLKRETHYDAHVLKKTVLEPFHETLDRIL